MRLRKPCEHGNYDRHYLRFTDIVCPGGEFLPEDALVVENLTEAKERATQILAVGYTHPDDFEAVRETIQEVLDALAADQVGEPGTPNALVVEGKAFLEALKDPTEER